MFTFSIRKFLPLLCGLCLAPALQAADLVWASKAVVKLIVTQQSWDVSQPWSKTRSRQGTCSGFVIEQGILTNAHCVSDATYIEVEVPGLMDRLEAQAVAVNHQIDLALLQPLQREALQDIAPVSFGELPALREKVVTVGYPRGGRQISYTEGVVSRIDVMQYTHSNIPAPLVQTDASINPGNSGGPVFSDRSGDCLGVATQKASNGEGLGYFIPTPIIRQFLHDVADGRVDGIPALGAFFQTLENPAARAQLGLEPGQSGIRVRDIVMGGSADGVLQVDDVLLELDGHVILNDGRVVFQRTGRIWLGYHVARRQVGERVRVKVSRGGREQELELVLRPYRLTLIPRLPRYDQPMPYYVRGGLLFVAVERRYLWNWGRNWRVKIPVSLERYLGTIYGYDDLEELVIISEVFDASVNKGYSGDIENIRVLRVNGMKIRRLDDVAAAMENNRDPYHVIELEGDVRIVLDRAQVARQEQQIRARYGIIVRQP